MRKQCCYSKAGVVTKAVLLSKSGTVYESSTSSQKRHKFTKPVFLPKSATSLRKQHLFPKAALFTKAVLLPKSGTVYGSSISSQNRPLFTKAALRFERGHVCENNVAIQKRGGYETSISFQKQHCLRKQYFYSKAAQVYETSTSSQKRHKFTKPVSLPKSGTVYESSTSSQKRHKFTKAVLLSKSGTVYESSISSQNRPLFTKAASLPKSGTVYERKTSPQSTHFVNLAPLFHSGLLSHIKFKKQHVPVLNNIFFAFLAVLAGSLNFCFAAIFS